MDRVWISLGTGIWGGATMAAISASQGGEIAQPLAAALGATLAGGILSPLYLRRVPVFILLAPLGTTTLGAALAGAGVTLGDDFRAGLLLGPVIVFSEITTRPLATLVWVAGAFAMNLLANTLRTAAAIP
jgi:hypothetical protein